MLNYTFSFSFIERGHRGIVESRDGASYGFFVATLYHSLGQHAKLCDLVGPSIEAGYASNL